MKVEGISTDSPDQWTAPFPEKTGFKARIMSGTIVSPDLSDVTMRPGREGEKPNYFNCIPKIVRIEQAKDVPFFSVRIGSWGFYVGHKVFGLDSPAYLDYPGIAAADVFPGSQVLSGLTARMTTKLGKA